MGDGGLEGGEVEVEVAFFLAEGLVVAGFINGLHFTVRVCSRTSIFLRYT